MELLNRVALLVRPKRRYAEWTVSVATEDDEVVFDLDEARLNPSVYLIAARAEEDLEDLIDDYAADIFEAELESWDGDEAAWPVNRSAHVFRDWFDVTLGPTVLDMDPDQSLDADPDLDGAEFDRHDLLEALGRDPGAELRCAWCETPIDRRGAISTVFLEGPRGPREAAETIEIPIAGRVVPGLLPPDESQAAAEGATAIVVCCGDDCRLAFRDAWNREHTGH